ERQILMPLRGSAAAACLCAAGRSRLCPRRQRWNAAVLRIDDQRRAPVSEPAGSGVPPVGAARAVPRASAIAALPLVRRRLAARSVPLASKKELTMSRTLVVALLAVSFLIGSSRMSGQIYVGGAPPPAGTWGAQPSTKNGEWPHYTADIRGNRYSPLDQINAS